MTKTEFLLIGSRQRHLNISESPNIVIDGKPVKQVTVTKSLGVEIDKHLNWGNHINAISKKIASGIGAMKRIRHLVPREILLNVYNSLVQPYFDYCSAVWGNCGSGLSEKLQKLQNRAARIITFSNYDAPAEPLRCFLNWKTLDVQRSIDKSILMFKSLHNLAPKYLTSKFVHRSDITSYSVRNAESKLAVPLPRTEFGKRSFRYSGAVLWNSLPSDIRQISSLPVFKKKVQSHKFTG